MEDRKTAVETLHRERIMDASERLFLEKGFQGTTIADISEAADYSRRTIYAYFENKDEILCGVVARGLRMLRDELRAVLGEKLTFSEMYGKVCARRCGRIRSGIRCRLRTSTRRRRKSWRGTS